MKQLALYLRSFNLVGLIAIHVQRLFRPGVFTNGQKHGEAMNSQNQDHPGQAVSKKRDRQHHQRVRIKRLFSPAVCAGMFWPFS
jgi:hypothetical protein